MFTVLLIELTIKMNGTNNQTVQRYKRQVTHFHLKSLTIQSSVFGTDIRLINRTRRKVWPWAFSLYHKGILHFRQQSRCHSLWQGWQANNVVQHIPVHNFNVECPFKILQWCALKHFKPVIFSWILSVCQDVSFRTVLPVLPVCLSNCLCP